jgi:hypothetical protein
MRNQRNPHDCPEKHSLFSDAVMTSPPFPIGSEACRASGGRGSNVHIARLPRRRRAADRQALSHAARDQAISDGLRGALTSQVA